MASDGHVQSLDRGLAILDLLSVVGRDVRLSEIAASTDLPKSTVHRLLATLEARGYALRDAASGSYRLGPKVSARFGTSREVHDILSDMAMRSGETVNLGVLVGPEVMYVDRADSPQALRWQMGVGSKVPAHCSGMGKAMLAHLSDTALTRLLPDPLPAHTARTVRSLERLRSELAEVRERGYAIDDEEFMDGVRCVAVPVSDVTGRVVAAMSLAGPAFRLTRDKAVSHVAALRDAARRVGACLGGGPKGAGTASGAAGLEDVSAEAGGGT